MKIVLIATPFLGRFKNPKDLDEVSYELVSMDSTRACPPYGIYLLSGILKAQSHEVIVVDLLAEGTRSIKRYLSDIENCSLVGIGATTMSWPVARDVINQIRQIRNDVPIVLGGIHPTMFDQYMLTTFPVQYVIRGEGEIAFPALCKTLEGKSDLKDVPNLTWTMPNGQIVRNPIASLIPAEELGLFPLPDYAVMPPNVYKALSIESSRGCKFDCSFCGTSYRKSWRAIPAKIFVDRLERTMQYLDRTTDKLIFIADDEFTQDTQRVAEIVKIIRERGLNPKLNYNCRAGDLLSDDFLENISEFTQHALLGAECGYNDGLKRVGKGTTCEIIENAARKLNKYGLSERFEFSFILGLPWESLTEVMETINFATHLHATYGVQLMLQWYVQMPGSRIWDEERRQQVVNESIYDHYGILNDLYLFRSGVRLKPKDIWELTDILTQLKWLADLKYPDQEAIVVGIPPAISIYYPRQTLSENIGGLPSLRQVAKLDTD